MSTPRETASFLKIEGRCAHFVVDTALYSVRAIRRAAHRLTGRGYVHLQVVRKEDAMFPPLTQQWLEVEGGEEESPSQSFAMHSVNVRVLSKFPDDRDIEALAGDFLNHLLDETLREEIEIETEPIRNLLLAHALSETALLRPELETALPEDDPLGIAEPDLFKNRMP